MSGAQRLPPAGAGSALDARLRSRLEALAEQDLYRVRRVISGAHGVDIRVDGRRCLSFCANDYLGLAADPRPAEAARRALRRSGTGSGAAALISGYNDEHRALEEALADFLGVERCLLFSTGWAANLGVLRALLGKDDVLIADELNHASLIDGGRLARAAYRRVAHADVDGYAQALAQSRDALAGSDAPRNRDAQVVVATDAVFSMDGDLAPLPELAALCRAHEAALMVDDAHGFGVVGASGRGAWEACFPDPQAGQAAPDVLVATLGKALGAAGAFVAGSEALIEYLIQRARTWVFSTAPPPAIAAAARESLRILQAEPERRDALFANIRHFRDGARQRGIVLPPPAVAAGRPLPTPIQPVVLGDAATTMQVSRALYQRGFWVAGIRPPTVPEGTSRLRITLSAAHGLSQIDDLLDALRDCLPEAAVPLAESAAP